MLILGVLLSVANAGRTQADQLQGEWLALQDLQLDVTRPRKVEAPLLVQDGPMALRITEGWLFPVFSGHFSREWQRQERRRVRKNWAEDTPAPLPDEGARGSKQFVGFVWVGAQGNVAVKFEDRADHLVFANRMVRNLGHDKAAFQDVAEGKPFTTPSDVAILLSIDPQYEALFSLGDTVADDADVISPFEIVVYGEKVPAATVSRARTVFKQRLSVLGRFKPGQALAWDRVEELRGIGSENGRHLFLDVHTETRFGLVLEGDRPTANQDQWLTLVRDETGATNLRRQSTVFSLGRGLRSVGGLVTGETFPPSDPDDPLSPPLPPRRVEGRHANAWVWLQPEGTMLRADVQVDATFEAVGGTFHHFQIDLPRVEFHPRSFRLVSAARIDGTPVIATHPLLVSTTSSGREEPEEDLPEEDPDGESPVLPKPKVLVDFEKDYRMKRLTVLLPEPLEAGEQVTLRLHFQDTWPYANWVTQMGNKELNQPITLGRGTGVRRFLPRVVGGVAGNPWTFDVQVATPLREKLSAAVSGETMNEWEEGDWSFVRARHEGEPVPFAFLAAGRWNHHDAPAKDGYPMVRTHLNIPEAALKGWATETWQLIHFYQGLLPRFPWPEQETFEAPAMLNVRLWVAGHGLTNVMKTFTLSDSELQVGQVFGNEKHAEHRVYAHEIAHQYWGHMVRAVNYEDFWFAETFAESYACLYVSSRFQDDSCELSMAKARATWEDHDDALFSASLTGAYQNPYQPDIVYRYGPYVFNWMLRERMGMVRYHGALDLLVEDHQHQAITTEKVLDYFNKASGKDQQDFFDYWVYQGLIPALELLWDTEGDDVVGTITTDVPFGTFDVRVKVGPRIEWITVVDGEGTFRIPGADAPELDPFFDILATKRVVKRR